MNKCLITLSSLCLFIGVSSACSGDACKARTGTEAEFKADLQEVQQEVRELLKTLHLTPLQYYTLLENYKGRLVKADKVVYNGALEHVETLLKETPGDVKLCFKKGTLLSRMGRNAEAVEAFAQAEAKDPSNSMYPLNKAYSYSNMGQYDKALAEAGKAIELDKDATGFPYHGRFGIYVEMKDYKKAAKDLSKFLEVVKDEKFKATVIRQGCRDLVVGQGMLVKGCPKKDYYINSGAVQMSAGSKE